MRKLAKIVIINSFSTLEINKRLIPIWGAFAQEKQLALSKKSEVCGILTCLGLTASLQLYSGLESDSPSLPRLHLCSWLLCLFV